MDREVEQRWCSEVAEAVVEHISILHSTEPNNIKRKKAYQFLTKWFHGHLGRGVRVPLPDDVVEGVRFLYPNRTDEKYVGYLDS